MLLVRIWILLFISSMLVVLSPPAWAGTVNSETSEQTLPDGRSYIFHSGGDIKDFRPLVIILHGLFQTAEQTQGWTGAEQYSDNNNFNVIFANGVDGKWNAGGCCDNANSNDVQYLKNVVDDISTKINVDPKRIYIWGFSNGGMMAYRAACEAPEYFAAISVQSGSLLKPCYNTKLTVRHVHGKLDKVVPYRGGYNNQLMYNFRDSKYEKNYMASGSWVNTTLINCGHKWGTVSNGCGYDTTDAFWKFSIRYYNTLIK